MPSRMRISSDAAGSSARTTGERALLALSDLFLRDPVQNFPQSRRVQMVVDGAICAFSFIFVHILRFDGWPPVGDRERLFFILPYLIGARLSVNYLLGIYRRVWRYVSIPDSRQLILSAGIVSSALLAMRLALAYRVPLLTVPISIIIMDFVLATVGMIGIRLGWRLTFEKAKGVSQRSAGTRRRTLLVGAGVAGITAVREIGRRTDLGMQVCGFLDDDPGKIGTVIQGVQVLGPTTDLASVVRSRKIDQVIITMASARRRTIRRIVDLCDESHVPVMIIPVLFEILSNRVTVTNVRPVEIEDLLGRDAINVREWLEANRSAYQGKRILVTGAGGSIGRELCLQLMVLKPESVILLDKDENSVFEAHRELMTIGGSTRIVPTIADLRFPAGLRRIFRRHNPQIVFHAAAHKHVPLMEWNAAEAVLNNIIGSRRLLDCVAEFPVERCVMVSTDKAVNPTNIMGATKRVAELMFQAESLTNSRKADYSCVRFGNVLGSRGSVIPIFREQIRAGGPLTVTHPEVERYFMTIPEAAQLIIQAGALGKNGEIFLLDMGEPVKVVDLARDMIRLSGLTPGEDIDIIFSGLRPGEKLKEELLIAEEGAGTTQFEKIFVAPPLRYDFHRLKMRIDELSTAADAGDDSSIYRIFSEMEIGFRPAGESPIDEGEARESVGAKA